MDFIVSLPESNGYTAILVIVDCFTKMSHFIPTTNNVDAPQTAQLFLDYIYRYHGLPSDIISNCGTIFTSTFWTELMDLLNVKLNLSTPYHPQTDGQTEHGHIVRRCVRGPRERLHDLYLPVRPIGRQPANSGIVTVSHSHYTI